MRSVVDRNVVMRRIPILIVNLRGTLSGHIIQSCNVYISIYHVYIVMNTTLQLVAIYNIQLHVSDLYVGYHQVVQTTYLVTIQYVW